MIIVNYMNSQHSADLLLFASTWGEVATEMRGANGFSQGSYEILSACLQGVDGTGLLLDCQVRTTGFFGRVTEKRVPSLLVPFADALLVGPGGTLASALGTVRDDGTLTVDEVKRCLMAMARRVGRVGATASLAALQVGSAGRTGRLPPNLFLNSVPNSLPSRWFFYDAVVDAVEAALMDRDSTLPRRMQAKVLTTELDPSVTAAAATPPCTPVC